MFFMVPVASGRLGTDRRSSHRHPDRIRASDIGSRIAEKCALCTVYRQSTGQERTLCEIQNVKMQAQQVGFAWTDKVGLGVGTRWSVVVVVGTIRTFTFVFVFVRVLILKINLEGQRTKKGATNRGKLEPTASVFGTFWLPDCQTNIMGIRYASQKQYTGPKNVR